MVYSISLYTNYTDTPNFRPNLRSNLRSLYDDFELNINLYVNIYLPQHLPSSYFFDQYSQVSAPSAYSGWIRTVKSSVKKFKFIMLMSFDLIIAASDSSEFRVYSVNTLQFRNNLAGVPDITYPKMFY